MANTLRYSKGAALPNTEMWLYDDDGTLIDLSGYTWSYFRVGKGGVTVLNKTTGISGAAGSGSEPDGTPNVVITWGTSDLDITADTYTWNLVGTSGGKARKWSGQLVITDVLPDPE